MKMCEVDLIEVYGVEIFIYTMKINEIYNIETSDGKYCMISSSKEDGIKSLKDLYTFEIDKALKCELNDLGIKLYCPCG